MLVFHMHVTAHITPTTRKSHSVPLAVIRGHTSRLALIILRAWAHDVLSARNDASENVELKMSRTTV